MNQQQRSRLFGGLLLILVGGYFLALQLFPDLDEWIGVRFEWPLFVVGSGILLLFLGLISGAPGFVVPASIIGGIGGILYWQNATSNFGSWAYMWTLIPGFVGVGTILLGLLSRSSRRGISEGLKLIVTSAILFGIFASFFGELSIGLQKYWPVLLILYGVLLLVRMIPRRGTRRVVPVSSAAERAAPEIPEIQLEASDEES